MGLLGLRWKRSRRQVWLPECLSEASGAWVDAFASIVEGSAAAVAEEDYGSVSFARAQVCWRILERALNFTESPELLLQVARLA